MGAPFLLINCYISNLKKRKNRIQTNYFHLTTTTMPLKKEPYPDTHLYHWITTSTLFPKIIREKE
jgi:hypothetical protein